jgi:hypothetical protein
MVLPSSVAACRTVPEVVWQWMILLPCGRATTGSHGVGGSGHDAAVLLVTLATSATFLVELDGRSGRYLTAVHGDGSGSTSSSSSNLAFEGLNVCSVRWY